MNNNRAMIFQIVHGSFVDGYGCRTTVFLKGCPLRCIWCCNPESQNFHRDLKQSQEGLCNGCGKCLEVCPVQALTLQKTEPAEAAPVPAEPRPVSAGSCPTCGDDATSFAYEPAPLSKSNYRLCVDRSKCINCGKCAEVCLTGELDMFGKEYTVDELFEIIARDERYYQSTGGGVTIGGGEPTAYAQFTLDLIRKCKENYINTALDTCGYITDPIGLQAFDEADMVLFDIKGIDPELHRKNTGVDNTIILNNLRRRDALGKPAIIRVPVIPGHNDSPEELDAIAKFISTIRVVERVDLIPFHDYCRVKYAQLGRVYGIPESQKPISPEEEEILLSRFTKYGLPAQIGG